MNNGISDTLLSQLSEFVSAHMGLYFTKNKWCDLERGIRFAAPEFNFNDTESFIQWVVSSSLTKRQVEILASHLTVGETYFFRDKNSFNALERYIFPELISSRQGNQQYLRIWSAGCSTGEEPYSIAILLSKMIFDLKDWNITILATDINDHFLKKATKGVYSEWSFRDTPPWLKKRYFKRTKEGRFEILPHIKKMVNFSYLNLAEDIYPSLLGNTNAMDLIFCRNVLMYFAPEVAKRAFYNLYQSLVDEGWLILSSTEVSNFAYSKFSTINFPGATVYKKDLQRTGSAEYLDITVPFSISPVWADLDLEFQSEPPLPVQTNTFEENIAHQSAGDRDRKRIQEPQVATYEEALTLYEQGHYGESAKKLLELLSYNQGNQKAIALLVRAYANQGIFDKAIEWCEKVVAANKLNPDCHYLLATILQEQGQVEEALVTLRRALYLDPKFVLAHFMLGNLSQQKGKLKESRKYFDNALSLLSVLRQEDIVPESEGITAGRLMEIIRSMTHREDLHE
jgi:chemotaxis protein methyltransferase CheR